MKQIKYRKFRPWKYKLDETCSISLDIDTLEVGKWGFLELQKVSNDRVELTIHKGYQWDGPSGPTIDTKNFMRGSLVHDALYQLMRMEKMAQDQRKQADKILYAICREDGMSKIRANYVYTGVRKGAFSANDPDQLIAP